MVALVALVASACVLPPAGPTVGAQCGSPPTIVAGASLFGCVLAGLDLSGVDLSGADLRGAKLNGADLSGANLTDADLTGADLTGADLTGADLTGAVLAGAILIGALFVNAILTGTSFDFGKVFGSSGTGGSATPTGPSCTGPWCPGYNEVVAPSGPGRVLCEWDLGGIFPPDPDEPPPGPGDFFVVPAESQLEALGGRSVVTDATTSFAGATFDFGAEDGGTALLRGLDLSRADFTGATFISTNLACKVADGGRFANTRFLPGPASMGGMFHLSLRDTDFSGAEFLSHYFCDVDLTGSSMASVSFGGFVAVSCAEFLPSSVYDALPEASVVFDGADLSDATIGGIPNPLPGPQIVAFSAEQGAHAPGSVAKTSSFLGTVLDGATIDGAWFNRADFTGASAAGTTVSGSNSFRDVRFGSGWGGSSWSGSADFTGAECPDGSTGGPGNPCFVVAP